MKEYMCPYCEMIEFTWMGVLEIIDHLGKCSKKYIDNEIMMWCDGEDS